MYALGSFAVIVGLIAVVVGLVIWATTRHEDIGRQFTFYGVAALLFGLAPVLLLSRSGSTSADASANPPIATKPELRKPEPPKYDLKLGSWRCYSEDGFEHIDGQVKNVSDRPIDMVTAVATFTGSKGEMIKTATALIEFQPLMPGQTSPFQVLTTGNPLIRKCVIQISRMFGGGLSVDY